MPRTLNLEQFEGPTRALLDTALSEGEPVLLLRDGEPVAVLASPAALETARLGDLPRWEEWLHEMKESITTGSGRSSPAISFPEPPLMDKTMLGFDLSTGTLGSDDGRDFLRAELVRLGVPINDEKLLAEVYAAVLALCEDKERLYEDDVRLVAQKQIAQAPQRIRLLSVTVTSATGLPATAEVTVELGHGPAMRREQGDGPLDAAFKALQRLVSLEPEVENFSVVAATPGSDALAEAVIALSFEGGRFLGAGASTNAIEAGIQAYVNALNFLLEERPAS
jgi:PHD/YefM family antitoxin component YafN of YafNO toxin-antitoxin module